MLIHKAPLRDHLRKRMLTDVVAGRFEPGARLGIADLAARYGISATPVREALTQLAHDGALVAQPNRGFFVPALSGKEAADVYPLLGALEGLALEAAGLPSPQAIRQLRGLNRALRGAATVQERIDADTRWHRQLLAGCPNQLLGQMLDTVRAKAERYERAFMRATDEIAKSVAEHEDLLTLLRDGRLAHAARRLGQHWLRSLSFIEGHLEAGGQA